MKLNGKQTDRKLHIEELGNLDERAFVLIERMKVPHFTGARTVRWDESRVVIERSEAERLIEFLSAHLRAKLS